MKAEIILTDNNINIDLNEPVIDVSTEDGFSVTIIGGVGPQGAKGDDYVLTEGDKDDIAEMAAGKVDLQEYVRKTDYHQVNRMVAGVVKVDTATGISADAQGLLCIYPASGAEIKEGSNSSRPITPKRQFISTFYGLAKAAGVDEKDSELEFGTYTDAAKIAIRAMIEAVSSTDYATTAKAGVVKVGNGLYMLSSGQLNINTAPSRIIKAGTNLYAPVTPSNQHEAVFYGLAKASGDDTQQESDNTVGVYTEHAKAAIRAMLGVPGSEDIPLIPVEDVQIDGTSILNNGVAHIPVATYFNLGVVQVGTGMAYASNGTVSVQTADNSKIQAGTDRAWFIDARRAYSAAFYGLAKAAGDTTQQESENAVGTYTEAAKTAIRAMLGVPGTDAIPSVPVQDVHVDGSSVLDENGVADIPIASDSNPGLVKVPLDRGLAMTTLGNITLVPAPSSLIKAGEQNYYPITPQKQHEAVFYGLAKAAGCDEKDSTLPGGQYTTEAKAAIQLMLGIPTFADIISAVHDSYPAAEEAVF